MNVFIEKLSLDHDIVKRFIQNYYFRFPSENTLTNTHIYKVSFQDKLSDSSKSNTQIKKLPI